MIGYGHPRPGASEQGSQITDVWHACQMPHADQAAANVYVGLLMAATLALAIWIAYRRATAGS